MDAVARTQSGRGQAVSHGGHDAAGRRDRGPRGARDRDRLASFTSTCRFPRCRHLTARYAERAADIVRLMKERPEWMAPLDRSCADDRR